jgi:hypothetical protein
MQPVSETTKEVEGEVGASVVHSPWNAPHGFLTPMAENLDEIQPSGAAYATESSFLGSRTLSCVPDEQISESLSLKITPLLLMSKKILMEATLDPRRST